MNHQTPTHPQHRFFIRCLTATAFILLTSSMATPDLCEGATTGEDLKAAIASIRKIEANGKGNKEAAAAIQVLNNATPDQIPEILDGMDGVSPIAANWFRSAVHSIASRHDQLPIEKIRGYFEDKSRSPLGRVVAFNILDEELDGWAEKSIPDLLDDPSLSLREKAVNHWLKVAESANTIESIGTLGMLFEKARDIDQLTTIASQLDEKGIAVDLAKQLGFIQKWNLVGRFDNKDEGGFDVAFGPEKDPATEDFDAVYKSIDGTEVKWQAQTTADSLGVMDLNEVIGKFKGETVYAASNFKVDEATPVEIRIGCINAHKVYVNGELVISNEVYHNGMSPDKFSGKAQLKKGDNYILVKICQNEQTEPWAQRWAFQLRVCDESGKKITPAAQPPARN